MLAHILPCSIEFQFLAALILYVSEHALLIIAALRKALAQ